MPEVTITIIKEAAKFFGRILGSTLVEGVVKDSTGFPIQNITVSIGGKQDQTATNGKFIIENPELGIQSVSISDRNRHLPSIDKIHVSRGDKIALTIEVPNENTKVQKNIEHEADSKRESDLKSATKLVYVKAEYQKDSGHQISLIMRLNSEGKIDTEIEMYGHITDWVNEELAYQKFPFILREQNGMLLLDYAGWDKEEKSRLDLLDDKLSKGQLFTRYTNEEKETAHKWRYSITQIEDLSSKVSSIKNNEEVGNDC